MPYRKSILISLPAIALLACFVAGSFTGYYYNDLAAGLLTGAGIGLIVMSMLRMLFRSAPKQKPHHDPEIQKDEPA